MGFSLWFFPQFQLGARDHSCLKVGLLRKYPWGYCCIIQLPKGFIRCFSNTTYSRTSLATSSCPYIKQPNWSQTVRVCWMCMRTATWPYMLPWFRRLQQWIWATGVALKILQSSGRWAYVWCPRPHPENSDQSPRCEASRDLSCLDKCERQWRYP